MQFLTSTWLFFSAHLRRTLISKRTLICLALLCTPLLTANIVIWRSQIGARPVPLSLLELAGWCQVQTMVPLLALILGSAAVAEEVEERTITYLFTRPVPRVCMLLGRWMASVVVVSLLLGAGSWAILTILLPFAEEMPLERLESIRSRLVETALLGGVVYSAVFAAAGAWFRRPIIVGLGYCFAVEGLLANLPGTNQGLAIQFYLKSYLLTGESELGRRIGQSTLLDLVPPDEALRTLAWITLGALLIGSVIVARRQYELPS
jgi:ABC-2 type transport system permease protein